MVLAIWCGDWEVWVSFSGGKFLRLVSEWCRERVNELFFANPPNISARLDTKLFFLADSEEGVSLFSLSLSYTSWDDLEIQRQNYWLVLNRNTRKRKLVKLRCKINIYFWKNGLLRCYIIFQTLLPEPQQYSVVIDVWTKTSTIIFIYIINIKYFYRQYDLLIWISDLQNTVVRNLHRCQKAWGERMLNLFC